MKALGVRWSMVGGRAELKTRRGWIAAEHRGEGRAAAEQRGREESALGEWPRGAGARRWEKDKTWARPGGSVNQSHKPWAQNRISSLSEPLRNSARCGQLPRGALKTKSSTDLPNSEQGACYEQPQPGCQPSRHPTVGGFNRPEHRPLP